MNLETMIMEELNKKFESGEMQKKIEEYTDKMINDALKTAICGYSGVGDKIQKKLREQMCEQIEKYDFNKYLPKLDIVLTEIINNTTLTGKKMIDNFKQFMKVESFVKIKMSEIFDKYKDFVADYVDTTNLKIDYDDKVSYQNVTVTLESEKGYFSNYYKIKLSCEEDEKLTKIFQIRESWDKKEYRVRFDDDLKLLSLSNLDSFDIFLIQLDNNFASIDKDIDDDDDEVEVEAEPEANFS